MSLLKDPFIGKVKPEVLKGLLDNEARRIAEKGAEMSNLDLYNLCLLNKERDAIDNDEKSNKAVNLTP